MKLTSSFLQAVIAIFIFSVLPASSEPLFQEIKQDSIHSGQTGTKQPVYTTSRLVTARPVIDGKLDDECWKHGTWAGDYHQFIPNEGAKPTYPTELNIQYDDKYLYIAFRAYDDEPEKIVKMSGVRDETVGDMVGLTLDSYRDYRTGFEFTITAWGQKVDLVLFNPMNWDFNWNAVWKGKVGMEDSAWVAELEVPFSQLRYSKGDGQVWGMHTWRWISRLQEESNWEIQSKTGPGMLYNFGELRGITGLKKSRRLEIMPFVLGDLKTMEKVPGNPFSENGRRWGGNAGLDAKIGISSNFTIDLTVNPDFGQVESDPSVMNLTAFETFYEEKRPFFLEGLTIFDYDFDQQSIFYSRRIGHSPSLNISPDDNTFVSTPDKTTILSAVKFSGTTSKGLSLGLIQSVTANELAKISDQYGNISKSKIEPLTNYTVARIQKGYKAGNTIVGGMLTSTNRFIEEKSLDFLTSNAFTGGLDLRHHWRDKEFYVDAKLLGSYVNGSNEAITVLQESSARYYQRPDADYLNYDTTRTALSGFGGKLNIGKGSKGFWRYNTGVSWLSPGLELNDLGYMNSSDEIRQESEVRYFVNKAVSVFHTYSINLEQFNSWNFNGTYLGSGGHLNIMAEFKNNWTVGTNLIFHSSATDPRKLRGGPEMIMPYSLMTFGEVKTDPSRKFILQFAFSYESSGNSSARSYELGPGISVRPLSSLKIGITADYSANQNELQYITMRDLTVPDPGKRYILGTIDQNTFGLTFRVDLNLSPEFSIQYYGSPFVSRGTYSELKRIVNPEAGRYEDRFVLYDNPVLSGGTYQLYDFDSGIRADYSITDPDFNFYQFRSNLVAKWEYRLGSFIYLVWSGERTGRNGLSNSTIGESYKQLFNVFPNNIFLVKLNYWFSL
ncbi:MAG: carbohydrate binding family 9 domain-containing protein [Bacteroidales bacterium]|nr:carbohydrate binding family 9 domain-containing protein [Bacteroidales bacterium]